MRDRTTLTILAAIIALVSARPYAGGWNDGSRLAAVESLVDRGTFAIDDSVFVNVPSNCRPYEPGDAANQTGTLDKLFIHGHFYSDKTPVPSLLMAGIYKVVQTITGLSARESPQWFCWLLTVCTSGLAYVVGVRSMHRIGCTVGLPRTTTLLWVISFALGTGALAYSRNVNNHIMLLGIVAALLAEMLEFEPANFFRIGLLAGLGYTIDLGIGPVLFLGTLIWLACRARSPKGRATNSPLASSVSTPPYPPRPGRVRCSTPLPVNDQPDEGASRDLARIEEGSSVSTPPYPPRVGGGGGGLRRCMHSLVVFSLGALPWLALHHAINYSIAGRIGPANANPEYLNWPGSPFNSANMTGHWQHHNLRDFLVYSLDLLFGKKGFISNNQMLILGFAAIPFVLTRKLREKPELLCVLFWSRNIRGLCRRIEQLLGTVCLGPLVRTVAGARLFRDCVAPPRAAAIHDRSSHPQCLWNDLVAHRLERRPLAKAALDVAVVHFGHRPSLLARIPIRGVASRSSFSRSLQAAGSFNTAIATCHCGIANFSRGPRIIH